MFCSDDWRSWPREEKFWSNDCWSWPREEKINNHGCWGKHAHIVHERVQILGHVHILCITLRDNRIICCQIFYDLLLKSAFEQIFNVMQLILVKIEWHIKWKYLIQKFHDIFLTYYFKHQNSINQSINDCIKHTCIQSL